MKSRRGFPIVALVSFVFFGAIGTVSAEPAYINISLPVSVINLDIAHPGDHAFSPSFFMNIASNVNYRIEITMPEVLEHTTSSSSTIIRTDFQMMRPLGALPETGGAEVRVEVEVGFNITTTGSDRAGQYQGTIILTVTPEP